VKARTVDRLVSRSLGHGRRARWALRRLLRAGDRGDPTVTDALWGRWLLDANDEVRAALTRWHRPHTGGGPSLVALDEPAADADVVAAARRDGHPVAAMARARILAGQPDLVDAACEAAMSHDGLAGFCVEHRLAPADPHRAAVYFLLTGQQEQYRLVDPDHSLLTVTYRGAREDVRARVRARVAGQPDLVRVLTEANRRDRMTRLSEPEAAYLTGQLAQRRDWPGLWALAKDLPVHQAVEAVRLIDGWAPDDLVFHALARADPATIATARAALVLPWSLRVAVPGRVVDGAFSPDGTRLAVAHDQGVAVHALPSGRHEPENSRPGKDIRAVLALDDALVVTAGVVSHHVGGAAGGLWGMGFIERGGGGRPVTRKIVPGTISALARRPGGYVALTVNRGHVWLRLQDDDGRRGTTPSSRTVSVGADFADPASLEGWALACDSTGGRIAVAGDRLSLLSVSPSMVHVESAVTPFAAGRYPAVGLNGTDRLVALDGTRTLRVWRTTGGAPRVVAERQLDQHLDGGSLVDLPAAGVVAVLDGPLLAPVRFLDGDTLADVTDPHPFDESPATCLFGAPEGTLLAKGGFGSVELVDLGSRAMAALADRPLAAADPADLRAVHRHLGRVAPDSPARPVLELLRVCLTQRFGADVALGDGGAGIARADDIALGGG
jgi:hypothetical protein